MIIKFYYGNKFHINYNAQNKIISKRSKNNIIFIRYHPLELIIFI